MGNQINEYTNELYEYRLAVSSPVSETWQQLAAATDQLPNSQMRTSDDVALMLRTLATSIAAKTVIDVGTFTGCSALALAESVPPEGTVTTFDVSDRHIDLARAHWEKAGVDKRISFELKDATKALEEMAQKQDHYVDLVFIDANKKAYRNVYELSLQLLRSGGYIVVDDTLWSGKIVDPTCEDRQLPALREFNAHVAQDDRVIATVLPIGNGLTIALKR